MHRVVFNTISDDGDLRNIHSTYECSLGEKTCAAYFRLPIQFPPNPKHLMTFDKVFERPDNTFVGKYNLTQCASDMYSCLYVRLKRYAN